MATNRTLLCLSLIAILSIASGNATAGRMSVTIPLLYNTLYFHSQAGNQPDISPDGRRVVFQTQQILQENIGIIDNLN